MMWALVVVLHGGGWTHDVAITSIPFATEGLCRDAKAVMERELKDLRIPNKLVCLQTALTSSAEGVK